MRCILLLMIGGTKFTWRWLLLKKKKKEKKHRAQKVNTQDHCITSDSSYRRKHTLSLHDASFRWFVRMFKTSFFMYYSVALAFYIFLLEHNSIPDSVTSAICWTSANRRAWHVGTTSWILIQPIGQLLHVLVLFPPPKVVLVILKSLSTKSSILGKTIVI